ncbi:MAG: type I-MYXAN CRISPR-associated protein Cas6/Cmx6 [Blastocatellia bacterium]
MVNNITDSSAPVVVVRFSVTGILLPTNHGYLLYSAICKILPTLHDSEWSRYLSIEQISGIPSKPGKISLPSQESTLSLRLPYEHLKEVLPLAGKRLDIADDVIRLGLPRIEMLVASPQLYARMVTIKKFMDVDTFLLAANRQLAEQEIKAKLFVPFDEQGRHHRRVLTIHDKTIVGFSLIAQDLSPEDSITLQAYGLGGRQHMGCGIFNPIVKLQK